MMNFKRILIFWVVVLLFKEVSIRLLVGSLVIDFFIYIFGFYEIKWILECFFSGYRVLVKGIILVRFVRFL